MPLDLVDTQDWMMAYCMDCDGSRLRQASKNYIDHTFSRPNDMNIVDWHKEHLGPQDFCRNLGSENRRFWCWYIGEDAVILVNSTKGLCIETKRGTTADRTDEIWALYLTKMEETHVSN